MAIMNKEKKTENKRINEIDELKEDEEDELEDKKVDMFFSLIKDYQQAKKRRRQELTQDSGDAALNPTKRSDSGIVPVFRAEDFSHCTDLNLKPSDSIIPTKNQDEEQKEEEETEKDEEEEETEKDEEEEETEKEEEEEETEKEEIKEDNGLDLNLSL